MQNEFCVNDNAIHPFYGNVKIDSVQKIIINGKEHDFFMIKTIDDYENTIMIPVENSAKSIGKKKNVDEKDVNKLYDVVDDVPKRVSSCESADKIRSGDVFKIAEVYRDLKNLLKIRRNLSFVDKKLLKTAKTILIDELCMFEKQTTVNMRLGIYEE